MEEGRSAFKILIGKPTVNRFLGVDGGQYQNGNRYQYEELG